VVARLGDLKGFQQTEKPPKSSEKTELEALIGGLNTKLVLNNRPAFEPPTGLSTKDLNSLWSALEKSEHERALALRDHLRRMKQLEQLQRQFQQLGGKLEAWASARQIALNSTDLGDTVSAVNARLKNLEAFHSEHAAQTERLEKLRGLVGQLEALGLPADKLNSCHARVSALDTTWGDLRSSSASRKHALEARLAQLQEIENVLLDFAKRSLEFRVWLEQADEILTDPITGETEEAIRHLQQAFADFEGQRSHKESGDYAALHQLSERIAHLGVPETTYSEVSWA